MDTLTEAVIGAAIAVHRAVGPGLLESVYETCLAYELRQLGLRLEIQKALPIRYKGIVLESAYRLDMVVESKLVLELKSVEELSSVHSAQLLSYLRLSSYTVGLLLNFNVPVLRNGIRRVVQNWSE